MAAPPSNLELRPLGNTGLKVSSVGFGASPLGSVFGPVSEDEAIASVREAFRRGINFFDTSPYVLSIYHTFLCGCYTSDLNLFVGLPVKYGKLKESLGLFDTVFVNSSDS